MGTWNGNGGLGRCGLVVVYTKGNCEYFMVLRSMQRQRQLGGPLKLVGVWTDDDVINNIKRLYGRFITMEVIFLWCHQFLLMVAIIGGNNTRNKMHTIHCQIQCSEQPQMW